MKILCFERKVGGRAHAHDDRIKSCDTTTLVIWQSDSFYLVSKWFVLYTLESTHYIDGVMVDGLSLYYHVAVVYIGYRTNFSQTLYFNAS
jgi:hypothetical protein